MEHDYLQTKKFKKKTAKNGVWFILVLAALFLFTLFKFASSGGIGMLALGPPSSGEVYDMAKQFVKATTRSERVDFPESGFQFAQKTDSIYVVRSIMETTSQNGEKRTLNFKAILQFKGGRHDNMSNWSLLNISED